MALKRTTSPAKRIAGMLWRRRGKGGKKER
jgi:hypothetical protein